MEATTPVHKEPHRRNLGARLIAAAVGLALAAWALPASLALFHAPLYGDAPEGLQRLWNFKWGFVYLDIGLLGLALAVGFGWGAYKLMTRKRED